MSPLAPYTFPYAHTSVHIYMSTSLNTCPCMHSPLTFALLTFCLPLLHALLTPLPAHPVSLTACTPFSAHPVSLTVCTHFPAHLVSLNVCTHFPIHPIPTYCMPPLFLHSFSYTLKAALARGVLLPVLCCRPSPWIDLFVLFS